MLPHATQSEHIEEKSLELYLKDQLSNESISVIDAHLGRCGDCVSKLAEQDKCLWYLAELNTGQPAGGEKRGYPRVVTNLAATIQGLNPFSIDIWQVRIINVSTGGLRVYAPKSLMPESLIKVKMPYSVACGDVRYCLPADDGFYAGVRLHDYSVR